MAYYDNIKKGYIGDIRGLNLDVTPKRSTPFKLKRDAVKWEDEQKELALNKIETKSVNEMCVLYLKSISETVEESTYDNKECIIRLHIKPYFNEMDITSINTIEVVNFRNALLKKNNLSNARINAIIEQFKAIYNYAADNLNIAGNPFKNLKRLKEKTKKEYKTYSLDDFMKYYERAKKYDIVYSSYFYFMFFSGCRPGEAMALKWKNVSLEKKICKIEHSIDQKIKGIKYKLKDPKNEASKRTIDLDNKTIKVLKKLKKYYKDKYVDFNEDCFVFGMINPLSPTTVDTKNRKFATEAKLERITIHDFRHSHATFLLNSTSDKLNQTNMLILVSKRLGHSDINETVKTYTHLLKSNKEILMQVIDEELINLVTRK